MNNLQIGMENKELTNITDAAYQKLIDNITTLWSESKAKAITAVNTELLDANWQTGKYIVEYELKGKDRAEYGKQLLVNLAKDLTARNGKGFSRSNLVYTRKFYPAFPICETASHKLTWNRVRPSRQLPDGFSCKIKMKVFVNQWLSQWRPDG